MRMPSSWSRPRVEAQYGSYQTDRRGRWRCIDFDKLARQSVCEVMQCDYCSRTAALHGWDYRRQKNWVSPPSRRMGLFPVDAIHQTLSGERAQEWCCSVCGTHPVSWIAACELCGRFKAIGPTGVDYRHDVYGWNFTSSRDCETPPCYRLCVGCWNKIRPLAKRKDEADKVRRLIARLKRESNGHEKRRTA